MVDDVLENEYPLGISEQVGGRAVRWPVHRGERTAVQMKPSEPLDDVVLADVHRYAVRLRLRDDIGQVGEPALRHEKRARSVPGAEGPADDLLGLGDEQAAFGFGAAAQ